MDFNDDFSEPVNRARGPRHTPRVDPDLAAGIERRMAAMRARYLCDQHDCQAHRTGSCDHPNHRRDVDLLNNMLDMLGLEREYPGYSQTENVVWLKWLRQSGPPEDDIAA